MEDRRELGRLLLNKLPKGRVVKEHLGYTVDERIKNTFGRDCRVFTILIPDQGPAILVYSYEDGVAGGAQAIFRPKTDSERVVVRTAPVPAQPVTGTP
jgi:hypothetical protein